MSEAQKIRRYELVLVGVTFLLYLTRRLLQEYFNNERTYDLAQRSGYHAFDGYDFPLHVVFPIAAGGLLLLISWYIFHFLVYPSMKAGERGDKVWVSLGLVITLVVVGVALFYYFRQYQEWIIHQNKLVNVRIYSLFRKRTVLADTVGVLIIFYLYQLFAELVYYLHRELARELVKMFRFVSYLLLGCVAAIFLVFAGFGHIPVPLWKVTYLLPLIGGVVQVHLGQHFVYSQIFPHIGQPYLRLLGRNGLLFWGGHLAGTLLVSMAYLNNRGGSLEFMAVFFLFTLLATGVIGYFRWAFWEKNTQLQTQFSNKSAQLDSLRAQINPHFLFNALNTLYASALKENSEQTAEGIQKLAEMMRFMLEENHQQHIPLTKEVEYLHNYIQIQRLRLDESQRMDIRVKLETPAGEVQIAPMLLSPLVENAFKHGISLQNACWIYITLTLDGNNVYFKVHNSLQRKTDNDPEKARVGVGLENVRQRLALLYPGRHRLDIQQSDQDYFVSLTLQYRPDPL
ncbi:MAG: histidine kinase [Bacteroidota bacterium]